MHKYPQAKHSAGVVTRVRQAGLALALLFALPTAQAAGLGGHEVQSALGQPLRMVVQVTARPDETFDANCFKIHPFTVANDGLPQLTSAQVTLDRRGNQPRLVVSSTRPILDPIVRVSIDVGCDTTLRRDLTLLLDPLPVIETQAEAAAPATPVGAPIPAAAPARPTPVDEPARAAGGTTAGTAAGPASTQQGAAAPSAPGGATAGPAPRAARPDGGARKDVAQPRPPRTVSARERAAAAPAQPRPPRPAPVQQRDRLSISASGPPLESYAGAPITPRLTLSTTLADRSAQPPLSESALSILRQKQARLKAAPTEEDIPSLEAELVVLQKRTAEMRNQLDTVMAQMAALRGPDGAPAAQPAAAVSGAATPVRSLPPEVPGIQWNWTDPRVLVGGALGLIIVLLIIGFALWLRRERTDSRRAARWNKAPYVPAAAAAATSPPAPPRMSFGTDRDSDRLERFTAPADRPPMPDSYAFTPFSSGQAASALGVSDLAQATEKASVFVTLGRPEQAIDVLRDHIDHEPKPSPMAWLMLLDLYRQTDRRNEFLEVARRFHMDFNAETPAWDQTSPLHDAGLAAFPHLVRKVRDEWPRHEARAFIEELLYDNRGGSRIGFSLPAFRDLLLLHSIVDDYIAALDAPARTDPRTGVVLAPAPPAPPPHLAKVWATASAAEPDHAGPANAAPDDATLHAATADRAAPDQAEPGLRLDPGLLSTAAQGSSLERSYPVIVEAIVSRWGKPGAADYLGNLIRSTNDNRGPGMSNETMSELIMLHDVALELADPEARFAAA